MTIRRQARLWQRAAPCPTFCDCLILPAPVQDLLMQGKIDMGHSRALLSLPAAAKQIETANSVAHKQLSVRD